MEQRTEQWHNARLGKPTSSRFNDIMTKTKAGKYGASRGNYMAELAAQRLTGERHEGFTSQAMQWGIDTEDAARLAYEFETGTEVVEEGFVEHKTLPTGASPDGLVGDDGLVEIKCPNTATHINTLFSKKAPKQYIAQMQGQMWITGRDWCDFVSYDPRMPAELQIIVIRVNKDPEYIARLGAEVGQFLDELDELEEALQEMIDEES